MTSLPSCLKKRAGVGDHRAVLLRRHPQHFGDMESPALSEDRHDRRARVEQGERSADPFSTATSPLRVLPKAAILRVARIDRAAHLLEERHVFRVGSGPSALDVVHAEVEQLRDANLVPLRTRCPHPAFRREGRVVDGDGGCFHGGMISGFWTESKKPRCGLGAAPGFRLWGEMDLCRSRISGSRARQ